ncbi:MAG TPA: ABC transporter ATP-binding protein [Rhodothermia bacterium]|nr:ABC transporter ATP-binding protein [Rhodothermia bacterium]
MNGDIQQFVDEMHRLGYPDADIKGALAEAGWSREQIAQAFDDAIIHVDGLKKYFKNVKAVDGVSFMIERGEIFGFLGPNGAGKTTTIRCMMDFLRPDAGRIRILRRDSRTHSVALKAEIGYLPGSVRLYDHWTGQEHVDYAASFVRRPHRAMYLAERLKLDLANKTKELSSGNRQKLGIVLALMCEPQVLIWDEPTLALDPLLQQEVYALLKEAAGNGATILMSSHNLAEVERVCSRVAIIKSGKIIAVDEIKNLRRKNMYTVLVHFADAVPARGELASDAVRILDEVEQGFLIKVSGDINEFLKAVARYRVADITIEKASLEDVFLEFYKA